MLTTPKGVALICENDNKEYLLHLRDANTDVLPREWCLIGGTIESGEAPVLAAIRELKEETGLVAQKVELYREVSFADSRIAIFVVKVVSPINQICLTEGRGVAFLEKSEAINFLDWVANSWLKHFYGNII